MACLNCSTELRINERGRPRKYCSTTCKSEFEYKKYLSTKPTEKIKVCAGCNKTFLTLQSSHLQYCSTDCYPQRIRPSKDCSRCGAVGAVYVGRLFCEPCILARRNERRIHSADNAERNRKGNRLILERLAPGLGSHQRMKLLKLWKSQMRGCNYCDNLADTIDHIVPLSRGGTNYENNLVPACRSCNSKKRDKLISEWKVLNVRTGSKA